MSGIKQDGAKSGLAHAGSILFQPPLDRAGMNQKQTMNLKHFHLVNM